MENRPIFRIPVGFRVPENMRRRNPNLPAVLWFAPARLPRKRMPTVRAYLKKITATKGGKGEPE